MRDVSPDEKGYSGLDDEPVAATLDELLWLGSGSSAEAEGYFPALDDYNTGPERYLRLVLDAKKAVEVPVIASLNGSSFGGMATFARQLESSGADAIELNIYMVAADPGTTAFDLEQRLVLSGSARVWEDENVVSGAIERNTGSSLYSREMMIHMSMLSRCMSAGSTVSKRFWIHDLTSGACSRCVRTR